MRRVGKTFNKDNRKNLLQNCIQQRTTWHGDQSLGPLEY